MKVFLAQVGWHTSEVTRSGWYDNSAGHHTSSLPYDQWEHEIKYHGLMDGINKAISEQHATIEQDGNNKGWGISTISLQHATELAWATAKRYAEFKENEQEQLQLNRVRIVEELKQLVGDNQPVYFFFKQDYDYRGLHSQYKGEIPLTTLVEYKIAWLTEHYDYAELLSDSLIMLFGFDDRFNYSLSEGMYEDNFINQLLTDQLVAKSGEVGYEAFSLVSIKEARKAVEKMIIDNTLDNDEDE